MNNITFDDNGYALCPHPAHPGDDDERVLNLILLYSCAVYDSMDEDPEAATPRGAITSQWRVECNWGHVIDIPADSNADNPAPFALAALVAAFGSLQSA